MTKRKRVGLVVLGLTLFFSIVGGFTIYSKNQDTTSSLIDIDSSTLTSNIVKKKEFWVYVGRPTCEECQKFSPILEEVLKENKQQIYYYNTDLERKDNEEEMLEIIDSLNIQMVPTVIHLKKGKIIEESIGYKDKKVLEEIFKS